MKKALKSILVLVVGAIAGCGAMLLLEYFNNGGSVEELKEYIK